MVDLSKLFGFDWDKWNIEKSLKKHGVSPNETEELFLDESVLLIEDLKHSQKEERFIAIGETTQGTLLFAVFTVRGDRIRIVSVRKANEKERRKYEES